MEERQQKIIINNRQTANLTGVENVISFEPKEILLDTQQGRLQIKGEELRVSRLTTEKGEVDVRGLIQSLTYTDIETSKDKVENIFGKLFR